MTVSTAAAISADNSATGFTTSGLNEEETTSTTDLAAETLPTTEPAATTAEATEPDLTAATQATDTQATETQVSESGANEALASQSEEDSQSGSEFTSTSPSSSEAPEASTEATTETSAGETAESVASKAAIAALAAGEPVAIDASVANITVTLRKDGKDGDIITGDETIARDQALYAYLNFEFLAEKQPTADQLTFTYTIPDNLQITSTGGTLYADSGAESGTWSVSGNVITIDYSADWVNKNPSDIKTHIGLTMELDASKVADADQVSFEFPGTGTSIDLDLNTAEVSGNKSGYVSSDGYVYYTVTLNPDANVKNFNFEDSLGASLEYDTASFKLDGDSVAATVTGQTATISLDSLSMGSHQITYRAKLKDGIMPAADGTLPNIANTAEWSWTGGQDDSTYTPDLNYNMLRKSASGRNANDEVTWTVTINAGTAKANLKDYVFTDTLQNYAAGKFYYTGSAEVKDSSGKVVATIPLDGNTNQFSYTFPNTDDFGTYTITYKTKVSAPATTPGSVTYTNDSELTPPDSNHPGGSASDDYTWNSTLSDGDVINKTLTGPDADGKESWSVHLNPISGLQLDETHSLTVADTLYFNSSKSAHILLDDSSIVIPGLLLGVDYTIQYTTTWDSTSSTNVKVGYTITFKPTDAVKALMSSDGEGVDIQYNSNIDKTGGTYKNDAR
ncbi:MAG: isopeptide-forming domain-containing fimbrial protein [Oscillospiraceae bacterium]|nr:isopeptide-forming domain-containing fimbrial protein [Oscillospiraceae bacterium]